MAVVVFVLVVGTARKVVANQSTRIAAVPVLLLQRSSDCRLCREDDFLTRGKTLSKLAPRRSVCLLREIVLVWIHICQTISTMQVFTGIAKEVRAARWACLCCVVRGAGLLGAVPAYGDRGRVPVRGELPGGVF